MGLRLSFLTNFPGATFIQGATFIPDSRVPVYCFQETPPPYFSIYVSDTLYLFVSVCLYPTCLFEPICLLETEYAYALHFRSHQ